MISIFKNLPPNTKAALLALAAYLCFSCADALAKNLTQDYSVYHLTVNNAVAGIFVIIFMKLFEKEKQKFTCSRPLIHLLRGIANFAIVTLVVYSFSIMPIAESYTMIFSSPFWAILIAAIVYKEHLTRNRVLALAGGFAGILIALRPDPAHLNLDLLYPLAAAIFIAFIFVSTRSLKEDSALSIGASPLILGGLIAVPFMLNNFSPVAAADIPLFIANAFFVGIAMPCLSVAFRLGATALVSPMQYTQIIWGTLFGLLFFGDVPGLWTIGGAAVIIASGIYLALSERKSGRKLARNLDQ